MKKNVLFIFLNIISFGYSQSLRFRLIPASKPSPQFVADFTGNGVVSGRSKLIGSADFDNDGDQDVIISRRETYLYINDGDGNFEEIRIQTIPSHVTDDEFGDLKILDINGDNYLDLLMSSEFEEGKVTKIFFNNKTNGFVLSHQNNFPASYGYKPLASDVDQDGDVDLLLLRKNKKGHSYELYLNDDKGNYELDTDFLIPTFNGWNGASFIDYDNDGDVDLLMAGELNKEAVRLYQNDGVGLFSRVEVNGFNKKGGL